MCFEIKLAYNQCRLIQDVRNNESPRMRLLVKKTIVFCYYTTN